MHNNKFLWSFMIWGVPCGASSLSGYLASGNESLIPGAVIVLFCAITMTLIGRLILETIVQMRIPSIR